MKIIYKTLRTLCAAACLSAVASCSITDLDITNDPNNPLQAAPNLILASAQLNTVGFFQTISNDAQAFVGILATQGTDAYNLNNGSYGGAWNFFYQTPGKDIDGLIRSTSAAGNNPYYLGIAQAMKAYTYSLMVDSFGNIPYSEAMSGDVNGNITPKMDEAKDIYPKLIQLCDSAVINLNKTSAVVVEGDLFYGGNISRWKKLANTVKLRLLVNSSRAAGANNTAAIQAIITGGDYIKTTAENFEFRYNRLNAPEGRHPWYQQSYAAANNNFTYFSHQLMYEMVRDDDPRLPYYFKRQFGGILNPNDPTDKSTIPCSQTVGCKYSYWVLNPFIWKTLYTDKGKTPTKADTTYIAGFFGRDRGDISGVPADVDFRTVPGTYPAGGQYDVAKASKTGGVNTRGTGDGIAPILMTWMVKYYHIESILALGVSGDAKALFEAAMREQIAKVQVVGNTADPANVVAMSPAAINAYVKLYLDKYDAAPTNNAKLNLVLKQAWFSSLGNGYETWNAFRRTGYPNDIQVPLQRIKNFALRLPFPASELSLNPNAKDPGAFDSPAGKLFWDPIGFNF